MNTEDRKTAGIAIFLGLVIALSALAMIWSSFLNKGRIKINAPAPYSVEIFGVEQITCSQEPCDIGSKAGIKTLILEKEGYKAIVREENFPLWRTNEIDINFEIIPYLKEVGAVPADDNDVKYQIVKNEESQYYKLISSKDAKALSYFPSKINKPQIFGTKNAVIVVDASNGKGYKVDLDLNSKVALNVTLPQIISGKLSEDKNHLLFVEEESNKYWLLNTEDSSLGELEFSPQDTAFAWMGDQLVFATKLGVQIDSLNNVVVTNTVSELGINVLQYDTKSKNTVFLTRLEESENLPTKIIPTTNHQVIYFTVSEKNLALFIK